ncbi:MAG: metallophosphoesterase [Chlamydiia bacterium]
MAWHASERRLVDAICVSSIIGIWPRFIEPRWVRQRHIELPLSGWQGRPFTILHLSDLHWGPDALKGTLLRALSKAAQTTPDLVLWTGDYLVDGQSHDLDTLRHLMGLCRGQFGTFASLGNHDYAQYVSCDGGPWVTKTDPSKLLRILRRLLKSKTEYSVKYAQEDHPELLRLLEEQGIEVLHNRSKQVLIDGHTLEIGATGDLWAGQCKELRPHTSASLLMCHNPDGLAGMEQHWSGVLAGHTHGRQVNIPGLALRLAQARGPFTRGLYRLPEQRWVHVSSGLGCSLPFRFFSPPEMTWIRCIPSLPELP